MFNFKIEFYIKKQNINQLYINNNLLSIILVLYLYLYLFCFL